jgi:RNase adaptor protein for sRNA GlmZ degradation
MKISILSFSYKRGLPEDASGNGGGFVFDCRAMPNPFWDESLRGFSGCDTPVVEFFEQHKDRVDCFLDAAEVLVRQSIEQYQKDGREHLQVAFGCTGNAPAAKRSGCLSASREPRRGRKGPRQHRSVYFAERMAERLADIDGVKVEVCHAARKYWRVI